MKKALFVLITSYGLLVTSYGLAGWQSSSSGIDETDVYCLTASRQKPNIIYAGTSSALYKSQDYCKNWQPILILKSGDGKINAIAQDPKDEKNIFAATSNGLYKSSDFGRSFKKVFKGKDPAQNLINQVSIDPSDSKNIFIATGSGLYRSSNSGKNWQKDKYLNSSNISYVFFDENKSGIAYAASDDGLYKSEDGARYWQKVYFTNPDADQEMILDDSDQEPLSSPEIKCIGADKSNSVYAGTSKGIFYSPDSGKSWIKFNDQGLLGRKINQIHFYKNDMFAATDKGVFCFDKKENMWSYLDSGMQTNQINCLFGMQEESEAALAAGTDKGIFKYHNINGPMQGCALNFENDIFEAFKNEPTITQIQRQAIKYAEVGPEKIESWRNGAKMKAILPTLSLGFDRDRSNTYEIYTSSTRDYAVCGPDDISDGWDVRMSWDLGDLIWNESQTSIDVRSKLMVQLRDDILDEVTKLYFERRRLQIDMLTNSASNEKIKLEKELRLQELTASIDGLTGGYLSKAISSDTNK